MGQRQCAWLRFALVAVAVSTFSACGSSQDAGKSTQGGPDCAALGDISGQVLVAKTATPTIDGSASDSAWAGACWQHVGYLGGPAIERPAGEADFSFDIAALHDATNLYLALRITDDVDSNVDNGPCNEWQSDGIGFEFDMSHDIGSTLDPADTQFTLTKAQLFAGATHGTCPWVSGQGTDGSWPTFLGIGQAGDIAANYTAELQFPLSFSWTPDGSEHWGENVTGGGWNVPATEGTLIGLGINADDNDLIGVDGSGLPTRDHELLWSEADRDQDDGFEQPALLGTLKFVDQTP